MNSNNHRVIDPSRFVSYYITKEISCINCEKLYIPAKDEDINELLMVSTMLVNNFCSRKCFEEFSKQIVL